jgi:hypothetical protein
MQICYDRHYLAHTETDNQAGRVMTLPRPLPWAVEDGVELLGGENYDRVPISGDTAAGPRAPCSGRLRDGNSYTVPGSRGALDSAPSSADRLLRTDSMV